jgi:hypothetical protein
MGIWSSYMGAGTGAIDGDGVTGGEGFGDEGELGLLEDSGFG